VILTTYDRTADFSAIKKQLNSLKHKNMTALQKPLKTYRQASVIECEKCTHFENMISTCLRNKYTK
jgi:hypothetical protein